MALLQMLADDREEDENSKAAQSVNPFNTLHRLKQNLKVCNEQIRVLEESIHELGEKEEETDKRRIEASERMRECEQEVDLLHARKR